MFSTIVKTTSYKSGVVRNLIRAENHFVRSISTSNDVKNSDILTKNEKVEEVAANKDIKKLKKRWVMFSSVSVSFSLLHSNFLYICVYTILWHTWNECVVTTN